MEIALGASYINLVLEPLRSFPLSFVLLFFSPIRVQKTKQITKFQTLAGVAICRLPPIPPVATTTDPHPWVSTSGRPRLPFHCGWPLARTLEADPPTVTLWFAQFFEPSASIHPQSIQEPQKLTFCIAFPLNFTLNLSINWVKSHQELAQLITHPFANPNPNTKALPIQIHPYLAEIFQN